MQNIKNILCPIAGSDESNSVIDAALSMAQQFGAKLTVLNVAPLRILDLVRTYEPQIKEDLLPVQVEEQMRRHSTEVLDRAKAHLAENEAEFKTVIGHPGDVICDIALEGKFDLIVIGKRKDKVLQRMILGSVTDFVVQHSPCAVLVICPSSR